jgi:hypothetical protein
MGILPKSERGRSDIIKSEPDQPQLDIASLSPEDLELYELTQAKRKAALKEAAGYAREIRKILPPPKCSDQLELALADSIEMVFSRPSSERASYEHKAKVERMKEMSRETGLHSS